MITDRNYRLFKSRLRELKRLRDNDEATQRELRELRELEEKIQEMEIEEMEREERERETENEIEERRRRRLNSRHSRNLVPREELEMRRMPVEYTDKWREFDISDVGKNESCGICLDDLTGDKLMWGHFTETSDGNKGEPHVFHKDCIDKWYIVSRRKKCPLCRQRFGSTRKPKTQRRKSKKRSTKKNKNKSNKRNRRSVHKKAKI